MESNTVFVLLAGGKSERMGVAKGLLKYKQTYWILEQLNRISKTNITKVYIGLGFNYQHYFEAIPWLKNAVRNFINFQNLDVKVVVNPTPELGSFSTLQTVLKTINYECNVLVNPIDVPILNSKELTKICAIKNDVIIPNFKGKNGHPIKMSANFWNNLLTVKSTKAEARLDFQIKKLNPQKISTVEVSDRAVILNLNTKNEWKSFLENAKL